MVSGMNCYHAVFFIIIIIKIIIILISQNKVEGK